jgi:hypothetical protein
MPDFLPKEGYNLRRVWAWWNLVLLPLFYQINLITHFFYSTYRSGLTYLSDMYFVCVCVCLFAFIRISCRKRLQSSQGAGVVEVVLALLTLLTLLTLLFLLPLLTLLTLVILPKLPTLLTLLTMLTMLTLPTLLSLLTLLTLLFFITGSVYLLHHGCVSYCTLLVGKASNRR